MIYMEECHVCGHSPASPFRINLVLCERCEHDYYEMLKYGDDTENIKRKFVRYRSKMQRLADESITTSKREILLHAWRMFCSAYGNKNDEGEHASFLVGRGHDQTIILCLILAARMNDVIILKDDLIKKERVSFKRMFDGTYMKNIRELRELLTANGFNIKTGTSTRLYMDVLLRKLPVTDEQKTRCIELANEFDRQKIYNKELVTLQRGIPYKRRAQQHVLAASIFYAITKTAQQQIANALHITIVPIQRYHKIMSDLIQETYSLRVIVS